MISKKEIHIYNRTVKKHALLNHLSSQLFSSMFSNFQNSQNICKAVNELLKSRNTIGVFSANPPEDFSVNSLKEVRLKNLIALFLLF